MTYIPSPVVVQNAFGSAVTGSAIVALVGSLLTVFYVSIKEVIISKNENRKNYEEYKHNRKETVEKLTISYYNQVKNRATITLWSSIFLGVVGFALIGYIVLYYSDENFGTGFLKVTGATTIEILCGFIFKQSGSAQKFMSECLEKLRLDRLHDEALEIIEKIEDKELRDKLKAEVIMKYSEIEKSIHKF